MYFSIKTFVGFVRETSDDDRHDIITFVSETRQEMFEQFYLRRFQLVVDTEN